MELQEVIEKRNSIRSFLNTEIDDKVILELIDAARLAPSAKNRQPWKFYIAKADIKQEIVELMKNWHFSNFPNKTSVLGTAVAMEQAPVVLLVFKDSTSQFERSDTLSIGGAIEHILLKATEFGLGSLWIADTWYVKEEISKLVGTDLELYSAIAIGHSAEDFPPRQKKFLQEILLNQN